MYIIALAYFYFCKAVSFDDFLFANNAKKCRTQLNYKAIYLFEELTIEANIISKEHFRNEIPGLRLSYCDHDLSKGPADYYANAPW